MARTFDVISISSTLAAENSAAEGHCRQRISSISTSYN